MLFYPFNILCLYYKIFISIINLQASFVHTDNCTHRLNCWFQIAGLALFKASVLCISAGDDLCWSDSNAVCSSSPVSLCPSLRGDSWFLSLLTAERDEASLLFWRQHGRYSTRLSQSVVLEVTGVQGTPLSTIPTLAYICFLMPKDVWEVLKSFLREYVSVAFWLIVQKESLFLTLYIKILKPNTTNKNVMPCDFTELANTSQNN